MRLTAGRDRDACRRRRGRRRRRRARHLVGASTRARSSPARASSRCAATATATTSSRAAFARGARGRARRSRRLRTRCRRGGDARAGRRRASPVAGRRAFGARGTRAELRVVGVTGSTGKTSTKDLLAAALASAPAYANPESYNNEFGLPLTLLNTPDGVRGGRRRDGGAVPRRHRRRCATIARPEFGVVTNVGLAHAEHLGGREGVAAVHGELLEALPESGAAVLDADDEWTPSLAARTAARGRDGRLHADAAHRITHVDIGRALHPEFTLDGCRFRVGLRGAHQVTTRRWPRSWPARRSVSTSKAAPRRMEAARRVSVAHGARRAADGVVVLNDAYNANPTSMDAALRALAQLGGRRAPHRGARRHARARDAQRRTRTRRSAAWPASSESMS